ncbi:hypothetical protein [Delftia acidovorans]|uniref:Lipoprotein n=1 Tax=Delftia acidovorans TaxID=80866 RepID=A0AAJ2R454_DELAC|nr:hypothetical protein [Delftia acidovorans]MDX4957261.1 hypothetical protein [Delftia acidovorans]
MMKILLATAAVAMLAGCQTFPQANMAEDPSRSCMQSIPDKPEMQVLKPRIGSFMDPNAVPLELRTSQDRPTPEERQAISKWAQLRQQCMQAGEAFRATGANPTLTYLLNEQNSEFVSLLAKLYSGEFNYGQFAEARIALARASKAKAMEADRQLKNDAVARQQAEAAQQMQLNNSLLLLQAAQPKPQPIAPLRPQVNCTSRNVMGTVQTNCW